MTKRKKKEDLLKRGAPETPYTSQMVDMICETIATNAVSNKQLCEINKKIPCQDVIYKWKLKYPEFAKRYREAKQHQVETFVEGIHDIIRDCPVEQAHIAKANMEIHFRKWYAGRLSPRLWGDGPKEESNNEDDLKKTLSDIKSTIQKIEENGNEY